MFTFNKIGIRNIRVIFDPRESMSSPIEQNEPKLAKDIRPIELANLTVEATNAVIETKVKTASVEDRRLL